MACLLKRAMLRLSEVVPRVFDPGRKTTTDSELVKTESATYYFFTNYNRPKCLFCQAIFVYANPEFIAFRYLKKGALASAFF
jgi:hypothetical protein